MIRHYDTVEDAVASLAPGEDISSCGTDNDGQFWIWIAAGEKEINKMIVVGGAAFSVEEAKSICEAFKKAEDKQYSVVQLAQQYKAKPVEIRQLLAKYKLVIPSSPEEKALMEAKPALASYRRGKIPSKEKQTLIERVLRGETAEEVAASANINPDTLQKWADEHKASEIASKQAKPAASHAPAEKPPSQPKAPAPLPEAEAILLDFEKAWEALRAVAPGSPMEQDVVESYMLRAEGFVAGVRYAVTNGMKLEKERH